MRIVKSKERNAIENLEGLTWDFLSFQVGFRAIYNSPRVFCGERTVVGRWKSFCNSSSLFRHICVRFCLSGTLASLTKRIVEHADSILYRA